MATASLTMPCSLNPVCRGERTLPGAGRQEGQRQRGFEVNTLTVVEMESYEAFAENLQQEIEQDTGFRFGVVARHQFAAIPVV